MITMCRSRGEFGGASTEANNLNAVFGARFGVRFFLSRSLHQLSLRAAPRYRSIASLWRARLSITLTREKFELTAYVEGRQHDKRMRNGAIAATFAG